jgi:hypothetical protein
VSVMTFDALALRKALGRRFWGVPYEFGPDGWQFDCLFEKGSVIVSVSPWEDGTEWVHASMSFQRRQPTYEELSYLHRAVWGDGYAYQVFVGGDHHVNIHPNALHLWGTLQGDRQLPDFGKYRTI